MKAKVIGAVVAVLWVGAVGRADFVLTGNQYLDVTSSHSNATLRGSSTANVQPGGYITNASVNEMGLLTVRSEIHTGIHTAKVYNTGRVAVYSGGVSHLSAYDTSIVSVTGVHDSWEGSVAALDTYNNSSVVISGGTVDYLNASDESTVDISDGGVYRIYAYNSSIVNITGGRVSDYVYAWDTCHVDISGGVANVSAVYSSHATISGGRVVYLNAAGNSRVDISGGIVNNLLASENSTVWLHGYDFQATTGTLGLVQYDIIKGSPQYQVFGMGVLTGKWFDGTAWEITISSDVRGDGIWTVPEPASLAMLALGGLAVLRRRRMP